MKKFISALAILLLFLIWFCFVEVDVSALFGEAHFAALIIHVRRSIVTELSELAVVF